MIFSQKETYMFWASFHLLKVNNKYWMVEETVEYVQREW